MKYIVTVDERGRIVLPKEIMGKLNLREGSKVEVSFEKDGRIAIRKIMSGEDIYGIAGNEKVKLEEVEEALGFEDD
ncbi:AbrB/MazE/SpoVT family DNA-binding domain-containing protein [Acidianus sp. HS-5]|uniref:AbrB/MazE/SpoVT family DNA-binding domain-containing protein n=1 Tax=Acidianus sp. HS-5 TaxID=2886040 RepID=UPI001F230289|nr:AbrB/MazE/SpoVT family DNA-binding domain-containing protein [Acidianus sp. HS-5]